MIFDLVEWGVKKAIGAFTKKYVDEPAKAAEAEREIEALITEAATKMASAQIEVNKQEAEHKSIFVAGWRPATGWVCALGLGFQFVARPILNWIIIIIAAATDKTIPPLPELNMESLMTILTGMLGLGGIRMWEKFKGVARESDPRRE